MTAMDSSHTQMVSPIWSIVNDVLEMCRLRRRDDSLDCEYTQNEVFQGNFRNLLRQIIDDQDYREVVDNQEDI